MIYRDWVKRPWGCVLWAREVTAGCSEERTAPFRRRLLSVMLVALAATGLLIWASAQSTQPTYNGLTLSEWLKRHEMSFGRDYDGTSALYQMRSEAIPFLIKWTECEPGAWRVKIGRCLEVLPHPIRSWPIVSSVAAAAKHDTRCEMAFTGFCLLGSNAAPAVPKLTLLLKERGSRHIKAHALYALSRIGSAALPPLIESLRSPDTDHALAAMLLGQMRHLGTNLVPAVPLLAECATNSEPRLAGAAARALADIALEPRITIPALIKHVERYPHGAPGMGAESIGLAQESYVVRGITSFGKEGLQIAQPSLVAALRDTNSPLRLTAYYVLVRLNPEAVRGISEDSLFVGTERFP